MDKKLLSLLAAGLLMLTGCNSSSAPTTSTGGDDTTPTTPTSTEPEVCEHTYQCVSDGEEGHHNECSKCHDRTETVPHNYDEGTPGVGVIVYECGDCGYTKSETVEVYASAGVYNFDSLAAGDIVERTKLAEGVYLNASSSYKLTIDANSKTYTPEGGEEITSVNRLKSNGSSQNGGDRTIEVKMEKAGRIIVYSMTSSSSDLKRQIGLWNTAESVVGKEETYEISADYTAGNVVEAKAFQVVETGVYYVGACTNASNFYAIQIVYDVCDHDLQKADGTASTCSARGTSIYTCTKCDLNVTVFDKARLEHTWDDEHYVSENGFHWHECSVCHEVHEGKVACTADETKHKDAEEPTADNPITYQEDTCSVCGNTWLHDPREYVAPDQKEFTLADASTWTDETSKTQHLLSSESLEFACTYNYASAKKLATGTDAAGQKCFKLDPGKAEDGTTKIEPCQTSWDDRYFHITGVNEGDTIVITANSGGGSRGIKFGFTDADKVAVPKSTTVEGIVSIEHVVTASEATSGVYFAPYSTSTIFIAKIVLVQK